MTRDQRLLLASQIAPWGGGVGLWFLVISPFFNWINFANGGVIGLAGDGKIVLGISIAAMTVYITAMLKQKWLLPILLGIQAWGTLAAFWMGALIWRVATVLDSSEMKNNPFAALFAMQISPGAGLYLGLIGGIAVAGALGFLSVRRLLISGSLKPYYLTQGLSCVLGIPLAFFVDANRSSKSESTKAAAARVKNEPGALQPEAAAKSTTKLPKAEQPPEPSWAPPDKAVRQGDLQVQITKTSIGRVPLKDIIRKDGTSEDVLLMISLELLNTNSTRKIEYRSWAGRDFSLDRDYATLQDNFGNNYRRINFGFGSYPVGAVERSESIYPDKSVTEVLVFQVPLDTATYLDLELPAKNYGSAGMIRFRIPMGEVRSITAAGKMNPKSPPSSGDSGSDSVDPAERTRREEEARRIAAVAEAAKEAEAKAKASQDAKNAADKTARDVAAKAKKDARAAAAKKQEEEAAREKQQRREAGAHAALRLIRQRIEDKVDSKTVLLRLREHLRNYAGTEAAKETKKLLDEYGESPAEIARLEKEGLDAAAKKKQ